MSKQNADHRHFVQMLNRIKKLERLQRLHRFYQILFSYYDQDEIKRVLTTVPMRAA